MLGLKVKGIIFVVRHGWQTEIADCVALEQVFHCLLKPLASR